MNDFDRNHVKDTLFRLEAFMAAEKYAGFDPYDVKGSKTYMWAFSIPRTPFYRNLQRKLVLAPLVIGESYFPKIFRWLFAIRPCRNAKGIALIAKGYLNLYALTGEENWKAKAIELLDWLLANQSNGYPYPCWGYPFDWDGGVVVPANTPASVVCVAAFDAFWQAWLITKNIEYLQTCSGICRFFLDNLNITIIDDETICFSYTPLDNFQVHNTNLLVADCLLRIGSTTNDQELISFGLKAANFAIKEQNPDGSIYYYGRAQNHLNPCRIDHYHSGFEMRCLYNIWLTTGDDVYKKALDKYYMYYKNNLVQYAGSSAFPNMYPDVLYPINIHSCAEAILLNATLAKDFESARKLLIQFVGPILQRMITRKGYFKFLIRKTGPLELHSNISYMRWGQAWMFLALSEALLATKGSADSDAT